MSRQALLNSLQSFQPVGQAAVQSSSQRLVPLRSALYNKLNLTMSQQSSYSERKSASLRFERRRILSPSSSLASRSGSDGKSGGQQNGAEAMPIADIGMLQVFSSLKSKNRINSKLRLFVSRKMGPFTFCQLQVLETIEAHIHLTKFRLQQLKIPITSMLLGA